MGDTIKEGEYKLVRVDKPITNEMKAECIGEFTFQTEEPEFDEDGEYTGECYWKTHVVPWDTCKEIYKMMLKYATDHKDVQNG